MPVSRQDPLLRSKVVALLMSAVVLSGCAALTGDTPPGLSGLGNGDVAARSGDAVVTVTDLASRLDEAVEQGALESQQLSGTEAQRTLQLQTLLLNNLLQIQLAVTAAADELGTEADGSDVEALVAEISAALAADDPVTDEDVEAAFEQRSGEFEQVSASHILVETEAEAEDVLARLEDGEDFADLAEELSQDPGSAANGGSLGLAPRGSYVPPFEAAIWDGPATVGEVLGPVETDFGFHVIRVDEFVVTPEDEARAAVREDLEQARGGELFNAWFEGVLAEAEPEVAGRFGTWNEAARRIDGPDAAVPGPQ